MSDACALFFWVDLMCSVLLMSVILVVCAQGEWCDCGFVGVLLEILDGGRWGTGCVGSPSACRQVVGRLRCGAASGVYLWS